MQCGQRCCELGKMKMAKDPDISSFCKGLFNKRYSKCANLASKLLKKLLIWAGYSRTFMKV